jgi:hypothetical protein
MKKDDLIVRKSFVIPHNNGEMWAEELDSLYNFSDIIQSKFLEDMKSIRRPSSPSIIAINLNQTMITKHLATIIVQNLIDAGSSVRKVAFVGLDKEGLCNMKQVFKNYNTNFTYQYFVDFARAKDWLI